MKLVCLNVRQGQLYDDIMDFVNDHANDTDVFCFQEVSSSKSTKLLPDNTRANLYEELCSTLENFFSIHTASSINGGISRYATSNSRWGLAMFVHSRNGITGQSEGFAHGSSLLDRPGGHRPRAYQTVSFVHPSSSSQGETYSVLNYHGLYSKEHQKYDSDRRLKQSENLNKIYSTLPGKRILCGDLNLLPTTKSLALLAIGKRDLIKEFNITSTRTSLYRKPLTYADYVFTDEDLHIQSFTASDREVSDHKALIVEVGKEVK